MDASNAEAKGTLYWGNIGIMENKMETIIVGIYRAPEVLGLGFRAA